MLRSRTPAMAAVLASLCLSLTACSGLPDPRDDTATTAPTGVTEAARPEGVPADAEPAIVDRVVDGDTIRVLAAPGSNDGAAGSVRVRLLNLDAPEVARDGRPGQCLADAAMARLATLLPNSSLVWLATDREDRDQYDRPLRAAWTDDGVFVNALLTEEGLAEAVLFPPNDRFYAVVAEAERRAVAAGVGLHGAACG